MKVKKLKMIALKGVLFWPKQNENRLKKSLLRKTFVYYLMFVT